MKHMPKQYFRGLKSNVYIFMETIYLFNPCFLNKKLNNFFFRKRKEEKTKKMYKKILEKM